MSREVIFMDISELGWVFLHEYSERDACCQAQSYLEYKNINQYFIDFSLQLRHFWCWTLRIHHYFRIFSCINHKSINLLRIFKTRTSIKQLLIIFINNYFLINNKIRRKFMQLFIWYFTFHLAMPWVE